jgi:hypothetical protein
MQQKRQKRQALLCSWSALGKLLLPLRQLQNTALAIRR